jgi:hypothetical protein
MPPQTPWLPPGRSVTETRLHPVRVAVSATVGTSVALALPGRPYERATAGLAQPAVANPRPEDEAPVVVWPRPSLQPPQLALTPDAQLVHRALPGRAAALKARERFPGRSRLVRHHRQLTKTLDPAVLGRHCPPSLAPAGGTLARAVLWTVDVRAVVHGGQRLPGSHAEAEGAQVLLQPLAGRWRDERRVVAAVQADQCVLSSSAASTSACWSRKSAVACRGSGRHTHQLSSQKNRSASNGSSSAPVDSSSPSSRSCSR